MLLDIKGDTTLSLDGYLSQISGSAQNRSSDLTISSFTLRVRVYDCPNSGLPECTVVGDSVEAIYVSIPPGQKRAFRSSVRLDDLPKLEKDKWSWDLMVREVFAR